MDGYSVHDAAAVLGIPEARVWELIARGVLAGNPEADGGMRVFLKTAAEPARPEPPRQNGNGAGHDAELSPFRELLSEFRNLTERYGQALLALGEARGEVAALRGRVDLLEARIDLRLPTTRPISTVAWEVPEPPRPRAPAVDEVEPSDTTNEEPATAATAEVAAHQTPATLDASRRRRRGRADAAGIAEALARAVDPALPELPGAREAAEALATLQRESVELEESGIDEPELVEALPEPLLASTPPVDELTDELPEPAVAVPPAQAVEETVPEETVAEETVAGETPAAAAPTYTTDLVEPDWFADGDFSWLEQANAATEQTMSVADQAEPAQAPERVPAQEPVVAAVEEWPAEAYAIPVEEPDLEQPVEPVEAVPEQPVEPVDAEPEPEPEREPEPTIESTASIPDQESEEAVGPAELEAPPATAVATAEPEPSIDQPVEIDEVAPPDEPAPPSAAPGQAEIELMWLGDEFESANLEVATGGWREPATPEPPAHGPTHTELSDEQLAQLARDEGWPPEEVNAIRSFLGRPTTVAFGVGGAAPMTQPPPAAQPPASRPPGASTPAPGTADWLRGRRGPAASAYRRLRRLFP